MDKLILGGTLLLQNPNAYQLAEAALTSGAMIESNQEHEEEMQEILNTPSYLDRLIGEYFQPDEEEEKKEEPIFSDSDIIEPLSNEEYYNRDFELHQDVDERNELLFEDDRITEAVALEHELDPVEFNDEVIQYRTNLIQEVSDIVLPVIQNAEVINDSAAMLFIKSLAEKIATGVFRVGMLETSTDVIKEMYRLYLEHKMSDNKYVEKYDGIQERENEQSEDDMLLGFMNEPKSHCKRHIWTDNDGTLRSLLVCSDEFGTREYMDQ